MQVNNILDKVKFYPVEFATDESADTSAAIDLKGYNSGLVGIVGQFVPSDTETLSFRVEIADCDTSGGTYSSYSDLLATTVVKTASGTSTVNGVTYVALNPANYDRYIKLRVTATTSIGTGNVDYYTVLALSNGQTDPQTQAATW